MYESLKAELKQIIDLVESVPERYRDKCFDLLFSTLLSTAAPSDKKKEAGDGKSPRDKTIDAGFTVPAKIRTFLKRYSIAEEQLRALVIVENEEVHFIHEPKDVKNATGQIQWALLLGLKSALRGGEMEIDPEEVRSICIEKGFYDKANFAANFKTPGNRALFSGQLAPQGGVRRLSPQGEQRLAELLKNLAKQAGQ